MSNAAKAMMKAAVFEGNGVFGVKDVPVPSPGTGEVLIKVEAGSICGSDLHVLSVPPGQYAKPGTILGHEFLGRIEELGPEVSSVKKGDRVIIEPIVPCGMCDACRRNLTNLCEHPSILGQTVDGGFAEYCVAPEAYLHPVSEEIPAKIAALAEPMACVMHGMMELNPQPYERVVLYGAGAIGLIFYNMLRSYGVRHLALCETMESRREDARRCGVDFIIDPMTEDVGAVLKERWGGGPDVGIDAVGAGAALGDVLPIAGGASGGVVGRVLFALAVVQRLRALFAVGSIPVDPLRGIHPLAEVNQLKICQHKFAPFIRGAIPRFFLFRPWPGRDDHTHPSSGPASSSA